MNPVISVTSRSRRRGGFILALTILIGIIAAVLVIVFQQSVAQEYKGTSRLVRAIKAEAIAESAVAKISGILNADRWEERYYLRNAMRVSKESGNVPQPEMSFSNHTFPFFEKGPEYQSGVASFVGTIGDAPRGRQRVRVRILVELHGAEFLFIYDLQYSHGLLGPLNRDPVVQRTLVLADVPPDAINATVDAVWDEAEAAKQTPTDPADAALIDAMKSPPPEADILTSLEAPSPPPADFFWPDTPDQDIMAAADNVEGRLENLETMDLSQVDTDLQQPPEAGGIPGEELAATGGPIPDDLSNTTPFDDPNQTSISDPGTSKAPDDPTLQGLERDAQPDPNDNPDNPDPQPSDNPDPQPSDNQDPQPSDNPDPQPSDNQDPQPRDNQDPLTTEGQNPQPVENNGASSVDGGALTGAGASTTGDEVSTPAASSTGDGE